MTRITRSDSVSTLAASTLMYTGWFLLLCQRPLWIEVTRVGVALICRFYDNLIYGRKADQKTGDGICICRVRASP